jgi:hypothetical protein
MSPGPRHAAAAAALASIFYAAPSLANEPQEIVRSLYTEPSASLDPDRSAGYFAADLAGAMQAKRISPASFDFRYGAEDMRISDLHLVTDIDHDHARVVAVFKNYGKANSVDWTLCRRADGDWRIADASSNTGPQDWDLRQLLGLPSGAVRC